MLASPSQLIESKAAVAQRAQSVSRRFIYGVHKCLHNSTCIGSLGLFASRSSLSFLCRVEKGASPIAANAEGATRVDVTTTGKHGFCFCRCWQWLGVICCSRKWGGSRGAHSGGSTKVAASLGRLKLYTRKSRRPWVILERQLGFFCTHGATITAAATAAALGCLLAFGGPSGDLLG